MAFLYVFVLILISVLVILVLKLILFQSVGKATFLNVKFVFSGISINKIVLVCSSVFMNTHVVDGPLQSSN